MDEDEDHEQHEDEDAEEEDRDAEEVAGCVELLGAHAGQEGAVEKGAAGGGSQGEQAPEHKLANERDTDASGNVTKDAGAVAAREELDRDLELTLSCRSAYLQDCSSVCALCALVCRCFFICFQESD